MYSPTSVLNSSGASPLGPALAGPPIIRSVPGRPPIAAGSVSYLRQPAQPSTGRIHSPAGLTPQFQSQYVVPVKPAKANNPGPPPATHLEEPPGNEFAAREDDAPTMSDPSTNGAQKLLSAQPPDQYFRERRPTDPFFYPTTINPLTDLGITAIENSLPPYRKDAAGVFSQAGSTFQMEEPAPLFVNAPLQSFVEQPEEMNVLQQQNDSLARQVQALEHAKSLAQVQQAQASERIRSRQEQLRKESQQAILRAKEMQADVAVGGSQPSATPVDFATLGNWKSASQPQTPQDMPSMPLVGGLSPGSPQSRAGMGPDHGYRDHAGEVDVYDGMMYIGEAKPQSPDILGGFPDPGAVAGFSATKDYSVHGIMASAPSPSRAVPTYSDQSPYDYLENTPPTLPTEDVSPDDISGLANRILDAHKSPAAPNLQSPTIERYVDALGNPLGPLTFKEFPNIKDDYSVTPEKADISNNWASSPAATVSTWQENMSFGAQQGLIPDAMGVPPMQSASQYNPLVSVEQQPCLRSNLNEISGASTLQPAPQPESYSLEHSRQPSLQPSEVQHSRQPSLQHQQQQHQQPYHNQEYSHHRDPSLDADAAHADHALHADAAHADHALHPPPELRHGATASLGRGHGAEHFQPQDRLPQQHPKAAAQSSHQQPVAAEAEPREEAVAESEELQVQLEQCLDTISVCAESITKENLQEIQAFTRPPSVVKDVVEACCLLLGNTDMRWANIKKFIAKNGFLEKLKSFKFQQAVTKEHYKKLREHLQHPDFDEEIIKSVCVAVVPMAMWCRAIGVYLSKTKYRGGPDIRPVAHAANPQWTSADQAPPHHGEDPYFIFDPDIEKMRPEELTAVNELTITRPGTGAITFHGVTDCTDLDFAKIVRLEVGEVLVYPEPGMKPPVGVGLNKSATVTMYQCWPPTGAKLLQDTKSQERYCRKIQQMTEQKNATFIDYDCASGIWKFRVDHF